MLSAWADSPTRFREDANSEEDLRLGGYRDRLLVELAQNAADAARAAGTAGALRVVLDESGPVTELRVANTGAPLTAAGVQALASLRASAKRDEDSVGQFGVGFAAVLGVSDGPRVISRSGGVAFSADGTRRAVAELAAAAPRLADELVARGADTTTSGADAAGPAPPGTAVPVLRLPWPAAPDEAPPQGFDTEVRLPLRRGVDPVGLLRDFEREAPDLLLALPDLREVRVGERAWTRDEEAPETPVVRGPDGVRRWLVRRASGELPAALLNSLGAEARDRPRWWVCWALPLDASGAPAPEGEDVLHAPTPTVERLSLPARLLASVPVEPGRGRVLPGAVLEAVLDAAADAYLGLVLSLRPEWRPDVVPEPGFPLSEVDGLLRERLRSVLAGNAWLPTASDTSSESGDVEASGDEDGAVAPAEATVLDEPSRELAALLADVVPGLVASEFSERRYARVLGSLGTSRAGTAEIVEAVRGIDREPAWWHRLYAALTPLADRDATDRQNLAGLPVPLADGRSATGVRDVLLAPGGDQELTELLSSVDISGLRVAHPDAAHPLLERLGARPAGPAEVLIAPALREAVERSVDDAEAGADVTGLASVTLSIARAAGIHPGEHPWLAALALPDDTGGHRRADELLLPDAPLREVLAGDVVGPDAPLGVLDGEFAGQWPDELLEALGVLRTFTVVDDDEPTGPDHELADEEDWWSECAARGETPSRVLAVRDLDLVADDAWPATLRLLAAEPECHRALSAPDGYTGWWIARYALLAGQTPGSWRMPEATDLVGLYDPAPEIGVAPELLRAAGVRARLRVVSASDAADLAERLGDGRRDVPGGVALRAHRALARAVTDGSVEPSDVDPPETVRVLSGEVADADSVELADRPWLLGVLDPRRTVSCGGGPLEEEALADLLDLPPASANVTARVVGAGARRSWGEVSGVAAVCELLGASLPDGEVELHGESERNGRSRRDAEQAVELVVRGDDGNQRVDWWVDAAGVTHANASPEGVARALAWALDRWSERFTMAALLAEPAATTLLR